MNPALGHRSYWCAVSGSANKCSAVVKPLPGRPHPLLNMLKEAGNFIKIVTCLAMCIHWPDHMV